MNGRIENKLVCLLLLLGAALASASVGCVQPSGPDDDADVDEPVAIVHQQLTPSEIEQQTLNKNGPTPPSGNSVASGDTKQDPQPQPWKPHPTDDRTTPPGTGDPADDDHPFVKTTSSTPSGGHHDG
jgi:hypothetical protein